MSTAAAVREFYRTNPDRLAALSTEAQHTIAVGARGRLHAEAIKDFNSDHRGRAAYSLGNAPTKAVAYRHTQPSGRKVKREIFLTDAQIRRLAAAAGVEVGKRGRLPKAAFEAAAKMIENGTPVEPDEVA